jgi:DNA-binding response OmpR family regulator
MKRILLVEDDPNLGMVLQEYLQLKGGFEVVLCKDGQEGLNTFFKEAFDICIFDVMMPKKDGFTLGKEIRKTNEDIPIIFATAKGMIEDKTEGFNLGADDYITKPFRIEELLLRINSVLKRSSGEREKKEEKNEFHLGMYTFDYTAQKISTGNGEQKISGKEAELLKLLCLYQNDVLKREEALLKIWNDDNYFNGRSMDVYLSKLRKYLKDDVNVEIINIHGKGYKLLVR